MTAKDLFEMRFKKINLELAKAAVGESISEVPFPLSYHEGIIWLESEQATLQWVLEMMD